jgi:hypothetical protein
MHRRQREVRLPVQSAAAVNFCDAGGGVGNRLLVGAPDVIDERPEFGPDMGGKLDGSIKGEEEASVEGDVWGNGVERGGEGARGSDGRGVVDLVWWWLVW